MNKKNQRYPVVWVEEWLEDQLNQRGWNTLRLKTPLHQGDMLAEKNNISTKIGVKSRKVLTTNGEVLQVYLGFHFHKKSSGDFLILHFNKPEWKLSAEAKKQLDEKFGSSNNYEQ
jgi:hypothetical protein